MVAGSLVDRVSQGLWHDVLVALTGDNVLLGAEQVADGFLLDVGKFLVEVVGEGEGYDR